MNCFLLDGKKAHSTKRSRKLHHHEMGRRLKRALVTADKLVYFRTIPVSSIPEHKRADLQRILFKAAEMHERGRNVFMAPPPVSDRCYDIDTDDIYEPAYLMFMVYVLGPMVCLDVTDYFKGGVDWDEPDTEDEDMHGGPVPDSMLDTEVYNFINGFNLVQDVIGRHLNNFFETEGTGKNVKLSLRIE